MIVRNVKSSEDFGNRFVIKREMIMVLIGHMTAGNLEKAQTIGP